VEVQLRSQSLSCSSQPLRHDPSNIQTKEYTTKSTEFIYEETLLDWSYSLNSPSTSILKYNRVLETKISVGKVPFDE